VNGGPAGRAKRDFSTRSEPVKRLEAEGGEALADDGWSGGGIDGGWCVVWTRSQCEQQVHDQLAGKGFRPFLPRVNVWSRRGRFRCLTRAPMFPGYLFVPPPGDKDAFIEVRKARGLVALLGQGWDRPALVPSRDIEAIRLLSESGQTALPHPYLKEGMRARIERGPLAGLEGILLRCDPGKGLMVLSVDLLQRSVAVEVDCTMVSAA